MSSTLITGARRSPAQVLRDLTDFLAALKPGNGAFIMLTGPHGSGKSELLQDLLANSQGWTSYRVASLSWRSQQSGAIVDFLLNRANKQASDLLSAFDKPKSSVLLIVDDAHWADEASLRELFEATRFLKHARLAVVLTALDDANGIGEPSMPQLRDMADIHIGLPPYDVDDVRAFALAHVGAHISPDTAAKIHSITGGRPGLIKEVLDAGSADHWQAVNPRIPIPCSWHAAFRRRLGEHTSPEMRLVLIAAALKQEDEVASGHFIDYLAGEAPGVLEQAFSLGILERAMPSESHVVNFAHSTDRAVVRSLLSPTESQRLHQKATDFYRERGEESAALLHEALGVQGADEDIALALSRYG
ncbi:MAG TPA: AAA family ATPase, partial [Corynebacterium sp.]|nr:AAA family ATPase [Corynebacterium sp.]